MTDASGRRQLALSTSVITRERSRCPARVAAADEERAILRHVQALLDSHL